MEKLLLKIPEVCAVTGLGRSTVYQLLDQPEGLPTVRIGRAVRIPTEAVRAPDSSGIAPADASAVRSIGHRHRAARQAAWTWLDALELDPVVLIAHRVKGKKKLAEILSAYLYLLRYSSDPTERPRILGRVRELAEQAARPEFHNMLRCDLGEFMENKMSD